MFDTSKARIQQIWQEKSYSISALIFNTKIWNNKFTYLFLNLEINKQIKKRDQTHRKILNAIIQEIKGWMFNACRSFPVHCTFMYLYDERKEIAFWPNMTYKAPHQFESSNSRGYEFHNICKDFLVCFPRCYFS